MNVKQLYSALKFSFILALIFFASQVHAQFDADKPVASYTKTYEQVFSGSWDNLAFTTQWTGVGGFGASDITNGYLQFAWVEKRIIYSNSDYRAPYVFEAKIGNWGVDDFHRGGMVIRFQPTNTPEEIQENGTGGLLFNRAGIAFFPRNASTFIVQVSGVDNGTATVVQPFNLPRPAGMTSMLSEAYTLRVEDFDSKIFVYLIYNGTTRPFCKITLGGWNGNYYTTGEIFDANLTSIGTFTDKRIPKSGKLAVGQRNSAIRLYTAKVQYNETPVDRPFDRDKTTINYDKEYSQQFNPIAGWDMTAFYRQWEMYAPGMTFTANDITTGALQFKWVEKRIITTRLPYPAPYLLEAETEYGSPSNRGGVVIRVQKLSEDIQQPNADPGFNREGIAFYPSADGNFMTIQFSGENKGGTTPVALTRIVAPKPTGVASLLQKGTLRIEDHDHIIYAYFNNIPLARIELDPEQNGKYTSGTVYNGSMVELGKFSGMEIEKTGHVAIGQRDAALRLYKVTLKNQKDNVMINPADTVIFSSPNRDLHTDNWVATDALGRKTPGYNDLDANKPEKRRVVGMFYITWHTEDRHHIYPKPHSGDVTKILSTDPSARLSGTHPLWTDAPHGYHWAEPEMGYFLSQDEYVIRKDMAMLSNAGVDLLIMDVTNAVHYWDEWEVLFSVMQKMKAEGNKVPQFCFWAFNGPVITVVHQLYNYFYKTERYKDLWFYWDGKPLLLYNSSPSKDATGLTYTNPNPDFDPDAVTNTANPNYGNPKYTTEFLTDYSQEIKDFFSTRNLWWGYYNWNNKRYVGTEGNWSFGYELNDSRVRDLRPQDLIAPYKGLREQAAVSPAQHPSSNVGKSWSRATLQPPLNEYDLPQSTFVPWLNKTVTNPEGYGIYFQERWDEILPQDPDFLYINDWNEWTAGKFMDGQVKNFLGRNSDYYFVDQYNSEYNRAIHPMKGGYSDNYYMQMVQNLRKYKGVRPFVPYMEPVNISIDANFADWLAIPTEYRDAIGDTRHRSHKGYGGLYYTNTTGRNDVMTAKTGFNAEQVFFYVKTVRDLTPHTDTNWMLLLIDADRNKATGWEGYDYIVNLGVNSATQTTLKKWNGQHWGEELSVPMAYTGSELEIAVPRSALGFATRTPQFHFKWVDNPQHLNDISAFFTDGEAAPDRRFNYNFSMSDNPLPSQSPFKEHSIQGIIEFEDFDDGGPEVAYHDVDEANNGNAYRTDEQVDIAEVEAGKFAIVSVAANEWLEYTVNATASGTFTFTVHYSTASSGNEIQLLANAEAISGAVKLPTVSDASGWGNVSFDAKLNLGKQVLRLVINQATTDLKLDKLVVTEKDVVHPGNGTGLKRSIWTASPPARWFIAEQCSDISPQINYSWEDVSPGCSVSNDFWNMRWEGFVQAQFTETYTIYVTANDLARVWINDQLVVDAWNSTATGNTITGTIALTANQLAAIKVDFAEKNGNAGIVLEWSSASTPREIIPQAQLYPENPSAVDNLSSGSNFSIYPNPAINFLSIDSNNQIIDNILITNLQGQTVWSFNKPFNGTLQVDLQLERGVYFVIAYGAWKKLIIQ